MKKISLLIIAILLGSVSLMARPGYSKPVDVKQPDGTTVTLLMHGDEFRHFMTTTDGFTVVEGDDGFYRYADKDSDGQLIATDVIAKNPDARNDSQRSFLANRKKMVAPEMTEFQKEMKANRLLMQRDYTALKSSNGVRTNRAGTLWPNIYYSKFKGLIVLVEFSDRKFLTEDPQSLYQKLTSEKNYQDTSHEHFPVDVEGSARDYFYDNSMGIFDPTFDVVGPVQISKKATDIGGSNPSPQIMGPIFKEALSGIDSQIDFSQYDMNNDGTIDMVYFIFAGYSSHMPGNNSNYLWPHANDFSQNARWFGLIFDQKKFGRYACSVEFLDTEQYADEHQYLDGIGTICHEFSHVLGLADHYDTDYAENGQAKAPDDWDIMASGTDGNYGLNPVGYNAFERHVLGFATPKTLDVAGSYTINPLNTSNEFYILNTGTNKEDFYIENRQQTRWDRFLPGHGMLVWRADLTNDYVWENNYVNNVLGNEHFELLSEGHANDLTTNTFPALKSSKGQNALFNLYDITESEDGIITFEASTDNKFSNVTEDFEAMDITTADATDVKGVFCNWNLAKATIEETENTIGKGARMVKLAKSGYLETTAFTKPVYKISFSVWNGNAIVRINAKYKNANDDSWTTLTNSNGNTTESISRNASTTITFNAPLYAGSQFRITMQSSGSSAATYIDDIVFTYKDIDTNAIESIQVARPDNSQTYNLNGQRVVGNHYRGITICNGKKSVKR